MEKRILKRRFSSWSFNFFWKKITIKVFSLLLVLMLWKATYQSDFLWDIIPDHVQINRIILFGNDFYNVDNPVSPVKVATSYILQSDHKQDFPSSACVVAHALRTAQQLRVKMASTGVTTCVRKARLPNILITDVKWWSGPWNAY